jgi:hypothetical protein
MKMKSTLLVAAALVTGALTSHGAQYALFNVAGGPGTDTLWAGLPIAPSLTNGAPMTAGFVTMGYFPSSVTSSNIDTIPELLANLGTFTSLQTATPGQSVSFAAAGYLAEDNVVGATITGTNALIGRTLYAIASNASSIGSATLANGFSLFQVAVIADDVPFDNTYVANPAGVTPIIGTLGSYTGDLGLGEGTTTTLQLAAVPEPSAALLGAIGALGLLRRRRN